MKLVDELELGEEFSRVWKAAFGETPPLGHILRHDFHRNWTRFHALPKSKRYAETQAEQGVILSRANTLAEACFPVAELLWVVTAEYGESELKTDAVAFKLDMDRAFSWVDPEDEPEDGVRTTFYAKKTFWEPFSLDWLFIEIAEDRRNAILFAERQRTVSAPYDGGFDIICPHRETIRAMEGPLWVMDV